jgi:hypothetical protein
VRTALDLTLGAGFTPRALRKSSVVSDKPLGDYPAFEWFSGQPRSWGPEGAGWRAWFGGRVVDGLCDVLDEHLAARRTSREMYPCAIGCVPWLTSRAVAQRLLALDSYCVVVDKAAAGRQPMVRRELIAPSKGFHNAALPSLEDLVPPVNGKPPIYGPYTPREELSHVIDPIRVLGSQGKGTIKPLSHAKLLVLGEVGWAPYDTPYGEQEDYSFVPQQIWFGSANWTEAARLHLETGFVCNDGSLMSEATSYIARMIAFSEPVDSVSADPQPDLVDAIADNEAFAEAARELSYDEPDYPDSDSAS